MAVIKDFPTPVGVVATYHKLIKVELSATSGMAELMLAIYSGPEAYAAGSAPLWHEYVRVPIADFEQDAFSAFYPMLTSHPSSYLLGGANETAPSGLTFSVANSVLNTTDPTLLDTLRQSRLQQMKERRDAEEFGTFVWDGSAFDASPASVVRLIGAVLMSSWTPSFSVDWTLADNTERTLTAAQLTAVAQALGANTLAAHERYKVAKTALLTATTIEEIEAVSWPVS